MVDHPNVYESIKEAEIRLKSTVVLYDGKPYYVLCITDHKKDGIFRIYLDPTGQPGGMNIAKNWGSYIPYEYMEENGSVAKRGDKMDEWMESNPSSTLLRKQMNSPLFNRFRPFPLGMMNLKGRAVYVERQPTRKTEQGLISQMLSYRIPVLNGNEPSASLDLTGKEMAATIVGEYPTYKDCCDNLKDPEVTNISAAFCREFAIVRGPIDTLYLAYRGDVVGIIPDDNKKVVKIAKKFSHLKEVVGTLDIFSDIQA